jgi:hypothetical protein
MNKLQRAARYLIIYKKIIHVNRSNKVFTGIFFRKLCGLKIIEGGVRGEGLYIY